MDATKGDAKRRGVLALSARVFGSAVTGPTDADEALRVAIVADLYAGNTRRVRALLDLLEEKPPAVRALPTRNNLAGDIDSHTSNRLPPAGTHLGRKMR